MPFCPICQVEYREGFTTCIDCDVQLVDELPLLPTKENTKYSVEYSNPAFLCEVEYGIEANMLIAALKDQGIPVYLQHHGLGLYLVIYMGVSSQGADIFVPFGMLEKAQLILASLPNIIKDIEEPDIFVFKDKDEEDNDFHLKLRFSIQTKIMKAFMLLLILSFILGVIASLLR